MTSGSSYVEAFGGNVVKPAQPSYLALSIAVNTSLVWPLESTQGQPVVAAEIDVTSTDASLKLAMPPGNTGSTGVATLITNVGANTFTVTDQAGNTIVAIPTTQAWIISLTDNSTANGTWRASQLGATTSSASAGALAGPGLQAVGAQLQVNWSTPAALNTNTAITASYRAAAIEWTGGAGTLQLDLIANLGAGWFCALTNLGSATVTLSTSGGQTINGNATLSVPVGNSGLVVCTASGFLTFGALLSPLGIINGGTGATTADGALTNFGGTTIGKAIFTAANAAAVVALLGISPSSFIESSVAVDQVLNLGSTNTVYVCTAALSLTLPLTTTLTTKFFFVAYAQGGAVTVTPQSTDNIDDGSAGANYTCHNTLRAVRHRCQWSLVSGVRALPRVGGTVSRGTDGQWPDFSNSDCQQFSDWVCFRCERNRFGAFFRTINYGILATGNMLADLYYAISDIRLKTDIREITEADGEAWVKTAMPMTFLKKGVPEAGFIAQDQVRAGYSQYVGSYDHPGLPELVDRGVTSRADVALNLSPTNYIAYLTAALQSALRRIEALEAAAK